MGDELALGTIQDKIHIISVQVFPQSIEALLVIQPPCNTIHVG